MMARQYHRYLFPQFAAAPQQWRAMVLPEQQRRFFPPELALQSEASFLAFRTLHLQRRVFGLLLPQTLSGRPFQEYTYVSSTMAMCG